MEGATSAGGSGPAPFLLKTYEMVDDSSTDHIVSWSPSNNSFIVWDPPEFSRLSLPNYFKHSNFSSFIRQLNTYGFRKIDPERWEFHNDDFVKGQKHLLKNIHRRKPIHSHSSHPQVDPERAAFEEEIDRLSREKSELRANVTRSKQQQTSAKSQLDEVTQRLDGMEERQNSFLHVFQKAVERPGFVENLVKKIESMDVSAYHKKRRLPQADQLQVHLVTENNSSRDNNNNQSNSRPEVLNVFQPDFSNTLTLELSPAISDRNLLSSSTHSSSEDWGSPTTTRKLTEPPGRKDAETRTSSLPFATETVDLTEAGTSLAFPSLSLKAGAKETSGLQSLQQQNLVSCEDGDGHISCQLNLSLASSPMQANVCPYAARTAAPTDQEVGRCQEIRPNVSSGKSSDCLPGLSSEGKSGAAANDMSSPQEVPVNTQAPSAAPVRVNDHFWEQFLTERPGSMDNEEASSNYRENPNDEQEDKGLHPGMSRTATNLGKLTL